MEPVNLLLKVTHGAKTLLQLAHVPGGYSVWSAPTPLADLPTPQGPLCEVQIISAIRSPNWQEAPSSASRRFSVEEGVSQGGIAIWDAQQGGVKIAEIYPAVFESEEQARKYAQELADLLEMGL